MVGAKLHGDLASDGAERDALLGVAEDRTGSELLGRSTTRDKRLAEHFPDQSGDPVRTLPRDALGLSGTEAEECTDDCTTELTAD